MCIYVGFFCFTLDVKALSMINALMIILTATIVIVLALSHWMGGLAGALLGFEMVEVSTVYVVQDPDGWKGLNFSTGEAGWNISLSLKNRGPWDVTFTNLLVNGKPIDFYMGNVVLIDQKGLCYSSSKDLSMVLKAGGSIVLTVWLGEGYFNHGQVVELTFQTGRGGMFTRDVELP